MNAAFALALRVSVIGAVLAPLAQASDQNLYFHLHQAYEFLEQHAKGKCPGGVRLAHRHLIAADAELSVPRSPLEPPLHKLWLLTHSAGPWKLTQIEEIRSEVQSTADWLRLKHEPTWHRETALCSLPPL